MRQLDKLKRLRPHLEQIAPVFRGQRRGIRRECGLNATIPAGV
jgi:hypothetical protein